MMRGTFDDVPLNALFPLLTPADVDSLRQAAGTVNTARAGKATAGWEWAVEHAVFPGTQPGTPVLLGLDVVEHAGDGDQLEFLLQVVWIGPGRLAIDVAVNVACWCEADHATHDVDALRLVVGEETSLPDAFRIGVERLTGWLADPYNADHWRAMAGLPSRRIG
ncbi:hypothetical protein ACFYOG_37380 [Streptomyces sp. NPDC007818]|uniref:hypothetical protein n=1 Tax=Streptomyces sp. NPDC007818 TaxID=3364780 RepID=UPI0036741634